MKKKRQMGKRLQCAVLCVALLLGLLAGGGLKARAAPVERTIDAANLVDFYNELAIGITSALVVGDDLSIAFDLPQGEVQLPDPGVFTPLPVINGNDLRITFSARNGPVTLVPHPNTRHLTFEIAPGKVLTLDFENVTIDGKGQTAPEIADYKPGGGGILTPGLGTLVVENAVIQHCVQGNTSSNGGGVHAAGSVIVRDSVLRGNGVDLPYNGGGLYAGGDARIENSRLEYNEARWSFTGGAYVSGNVTVSGSVFHSNFGQNNGGGLYAGGSVTVENDSLFAYNESSFGGGIHSGGDIIVSGSRFDHNRAKGGDFDTVSGGAIYARNNSAATTVALSGSSFTGNEATAGLYGHGGALGWSGNFDGTLTIINCDFTDNAADEGFWITPAEAASPPYNTWSGNTHSAPFTHIANNHDVRYSGPTALYSLIFHRNDGSVADYYGRLPLVSTLVSLHGLFPADPVRAGYAFVEWNTAADGTGTAVSEATPVTDFSSLTKSLILYAQWEEAFTVGFDTRGGSPVTSQTVTPGGTVTRPPNPTRPGYLFTGWFRDAGLGTPYNFSDPVTGDLTLYAGWKSGGSTGYTVRFDTGGGSTVPPQTVDRNGVVRKPDDPTRAGFTFTGWYTDAAGTDPYDFDRRVTGDFVLYAGWVEDGETVRPYIAGYPDGTFRPDRTITRAEAAEMLYNLARGEITIPTANAAAAAPFPDVPAGEWYSDAVSYLRDTGVIAGYPDGSFGPSRPITRKEFTVMIVRYMGLTATGTPGFPDVPAGWAAGYIAAAEAAGLIAGYPDGNFGPENNITRAQSVTVLNRMLERDTEAALFDGLEMPFGDVKITHWAYYHIMAAAVEHQTTV